MQQPLPKRQKIIWPDNMHYFFTSSTFLHYPYFKEYPQKQLVLNKIKEISKIFNIPIPIYSIAINHLHLKFYLTSGQLMTKIKNILHSGISREYRKKYKTPYKEFWQSTRTYYIKDEGDSWKITGYIIGNLLKHKEVNTFEELEQNPFSSFKNFVEKYGIELTKDLVYSVIHIDEDVEGIIDREALKLVDSTPPMAAVVALHGGIKKMS